VNLLFFVAIVFLSRVEHETRKLAEDLAISNWTSTNGRAPMTRVDILMPTTATTP
jgi:hypothetical protein